MPTRSPNHEAQRRNRGIFSALSALALITLSPCTVQAEEPAEPPTKPEVLPLLAITARQTPQPPFPDLITPRREQGMSFEGYEQSPFAQTLKKARAIQWAFYQFASFRKDIGSWYDGYLHRNNINRFSTDTRRDIARTAYKTAAAIDYFAKAGIFDELQILKLTDPILLPTPPTQTDLDQIERYSSGLHHDPLLLSNLLYKRFWIAIERKDPATAFSTIEPRLVLARSIMASPALPKPFHRVSIYEGLIEQIIDTAQKGDFSSEQLRDIRTLLSAARPHVHQFSLREYRDYCVLLLWLEQQPIEIVREKFHSNLVSVIDKHRKETWISPPPAHAEPYEPALPKMPFSEAVQQLDETLRQSEFIVTTPRYQHRAEILAATNAMTPHALIGPVSNLSRLFEYNDVAQLHFLAADTTIAVELFRREHNRLPDSLEELVPRYLEQVPIDICSGKPLIYRKLAGDDIKTFDRDWMLISTGDDQTVNPNRFVRFINEGLSFRGIGGDIDLNPTSYYQQPDNPHSTLERCCKQSWLTDKPCIHADPPPSR